MWEEGWGPDHHLQARATISFGISDTVSRSFCSLVLPPDLGDREDRGGFRGPYPEELVGEVRSRDAQNCQATISKGMEEYRHSWEGHSRLAQELAAHRQRV